MSVLTDWDLLYWIWLYERTHHIVGCDLTDLSYCLDCHSGVHWAREQLRERGINEWPAEWIEP